jgi:hypothetical protein
MFFCSIGKSHCLNVLTCSNREDDTNVLQLANKAVVEVADESGSPKENAVNNDPTVKKNGMEPEKTSGNTARISRRISRSVASSGVSLARGPYKVTLRWLINEDVDPYRGIHLRNLRCRDSFAYVIKQLSSILSSLYKTKTHLCI